jgi:NFU1 iron-sulfur cluster scaffold homolog, mitochondrial
MSDDLEIRIEATPNPQSLKFSLNRTVWEGRAQTFSDATQAFASPLARELLGVPGVKSVFFLRDFVTISREPDAPWETIAPEVERVLRGYFK